MIYNAKNLFIKDRYLGVDLNNLYKKNNPDNQIGYIAFLRELLVNNETIEKQKNQIIQQQENRILISPPANEIVLREIGEDEDSFISPSPEEILYKEEVGAEAPNNDEMIDDDENEIDENEINNFVNQLEVDTNKSVYDREIMPAGRIDDLFYINDEFRGNYPKLAAELEALQLKFVNVCGEFIKNPIRMMLGQEKLTSEEAKNIFINWMSWKIQHSLLTNNALNLSLTWLKDLSTLTPGELLAKIKKDINAQPTGDTLWNQWKFDGTMHKVHDFAVSDPKICITSTQILEKILISIEKNPKQRQIVQDFQSICESNQNFATEVIVTGMLVYKIDADQVSKLLTQISNDESLFFNVFACATNLFKNIAGDEKTKGDIEQLNRQIILCADKNPGLIKQILSMVNEHVDNNPEFTKILNSTIQETDKIITTAPYLVKKTINAAPFIIRHPLLLKTSLSLGKIGLNLLSFSNSSERMKDKYHLHEDPFGMPMDFEPFEGNPVLINPEVLELGRLGIGCVELLLKGINPNDSLIIPEDKSTQSMLSKVMQATWLEAEASIKEEQNQMVNSLANNAGIELGYKGFELLAAARSGKLKKMSFIEMGASFGSGVKDIVWNSFSSTIAFSTKKILFDAGRKALINVLDERVGTKIPQLQAATTIYRLGSAIITAKTKKQALENVALATREIGITAIASWIAPTIASTLTSGLEEGVNNKILSVVTGGIAMVVLLKLADQIIPPSRLIKKEIKEN